jgi:prepilin-type N-terminal cleavage/methylation domain-containing protein
MEMTMSIQRLHGFRGDARRAFTLTELLVVIGIMAIMIGFALPAFRGLGQGSAMRTSVFQLKTTLALARQWAITHRQYTYVVFPDRLINYAGLGAERYKDRHAYGVYAVTNRGTGEGYYVREWVFLPPGIVVDDSPTNSQSVFATTRVSNIPLGGQTPSMCGVGFKFDGSPVNGSGYEVYLWEGWADVSTNSNPWSINYGIKPGGMKFGVEVISLTGAVRTRDYGAVP